MAESPTGSYNSYSADEKEKVNAFMSAYSTLEAVIPSKKEVPIYEEGKQVGDTLSFLIYIDQMTNKLPETATQQLTGLHQDTATICGNTGTVLYYDINNVIYCAEWRMESCDDTSKQQLINYLTKRYGEAIKSEDQKITWSSENGKTDGLYITMTLGENDNVKITWIQGD